MATTTVTLQVTYPCRLVRVLQFRQTQLLVGALTGVSITFCQYLLFLFGREDASFTDWRVILCLVVAYGVPMVYIRLGSKVLEAIWKGHGGIDAAGAT